MFSICNKKKMISCIVIIIIIFFTIFFSFKIFHTGLPYGQYKPNECIYLSPICSSRETEQRVTKTSTIRIEKDSFQIEYSSGRKEELTGITYKKEKMSSEMMKEISRGESTISNYKKKYIYSIYRWGIKQKYAIYTLDDKVWIALSTHVSGDFKMSYIYSIYETIKLS